MGLFNNMLGSDESLFRDVVSLDYDYLPKLLPYRENEQKYMASCIKPLFQKRNGKNLFLYGAPGIGKTAATRHILKELEDETDEIVPIYVNCWQKNTTYKIIIDICEQLDYRFTHNKNTIELFEIIKSMMNKKSAVFVFDEIDKLEEFDFLYMILEQIYRKTIFLITNYRSWLIELEERLKSRLTPELMEFKPYNEAETKGILKHRLEYAFASGAWNEDAFEIVANKTAELKDIRSGLYLLKESGNAAENKASRKITVEHVNEAIAKFDEFKIKSSADLMDETKKILELIKANDGKKIGELFKMYKGNNGAMSYKTFQRKIAHLEEGKFISVTKTSGGEAGMTTIINYSKSKKLTDF
jgi:cell division control protein 6